MEHRYEQKRLEYQKNIVNGTINKLSNTELESNNNEITKINLKNIACHSPQQKPKYPIQINKVIVVITG